MLHAAFGQFDYTPPLGLPVGRLGINRHFANEVISPLKVRAALFDDGHERAMVVALDIGFLFTGAVNILRQSVRRAIGVEHAVIAATHSHNGPMLTIWHDDDDGFAAATRIGERLADLARGLQSRLEPVALRFASGPAPGWSWNRRPIYRSDDGTEWVGTHGPRSGPDFVRMEDEDEKAIRVLHAVDPRGKTVGGFVNFWCHPTTLYNEKAWAADFPGPLLDRVEQRLGGSFVYLTGPAGDLSNNGGHPDVKVSAGREYCVRMGHALADHAIDALASATPVTRNQVRVRRTLLPLRVRPVSGSQVRLAREYLETQRALQAAGQTPAPLPGQPSLVRKMHDIETHFHHRSPIVDDWMAREVVGMWEMQRRIGLPEIVEDVELQAIGIGDFALPALPCELFSGLGRSLVQQSPLRHAMAVELANGFHGYVPPESSYSRGGYECCLGHQNRLEKAAGHKIVAAMIELLGPMAR